MRTIEYKCGKFLVAGRWMAPYKASITLAYHLMDYTGPLNGAQPVVYFKVIDRDIHEARTMVVTASGWFFVDTLPAVWRRAN